MTKIAKHLLECFSVEFLFTPIKKPKFLKHYQPKYKLRNQSQKDDWTNVGNDLRKAISNYKASVQK